MICRKKKEVFTRSFFSKNFATVKGNGIIDPSGVFAHRWNKVFLTASIVSLFIDPLFLMVPVVKAEFCIDKELPLQVNLTVIRSVTDLFYLIKIFVQFRTAYVAPSSRVLGRGELVLDPWKIALRYLRSSFWVDIVAVLPLPQVYFWEFIPRIRGMVVSDYKTTLKFITMGQFILRLVLAYPLFIHIAKATGIMSRKAWFGAAYNLLFFILASDVSGSCWYLLTIQRQLACWRSLCKQNSTIMCDYSYFDCSMIYNQDRNSWIQSSNISNLCQPRADYYQFGIYAEIVDTAATSAPFFHKFFYSLWWGLRTLCSLGQNLITSIYPGENWFAMLVTTLGLINYALLIGNFQSYILSTTVRLDKWIIERNETEQWMHHRQLPQDLKENIRKHDRYRWVATQGINEEGLLQGLHPDLRRQIKRYLCLDLVRRVPLFNQMDDRLLDTICERLKPRLYTEYTLLVSEGEPITEMLFIVRGHLYSYTTDGGRVGFFNSSEVGPGEFCFEQLLTWALEPPLNDKETLPSSTFTVKAITDVEAFALEADDLRFSALQFRKLHSKELKHTLRFYSCQWRTWAACYIQAAWRKHKKRKLLHELNAKETKQGMNVIDDDSAIYDEMESFVPKPYSGEGVYAARVMSNLRRGSSSNRFGPDSYVVQYTL
ncbi:protein CNGC15b [Beta vulgaris subsp. vulgaris]|uniref:protein CNGC15b n=1 Tax=Beta vulgaris subsp. vulgaris TaxID=3555 RepID=UPI002036E42E|nr:protein CNGC15b [Beta vulgaris subsp. vulgaris]XP_048492548.1 protein CNGC15b [Beta vulgaris subsp. vulgaris]XP_048492549.1 protein CNGC15b [Beta vulgaris subsp. vulgaris]XP_057247931.1 protein CNGC15b [Beta vulgaris subsp. vulgaris]